MLQRTGPQLLFLIALCSVLYTRTLSQPYASMRKVSSSSIVMYRYVQSPKMSARQGDASIQIRDFLIRLLKNHSRVLRVPKRHADGLFTSGYSKLLGQLSARRYLESLIGKRVSDELMEEPVKRHSDAIFTDNYSRFRKQMAVKKYLNSVLTGKRRFCSVNSLEDPGTNDLEESRE
uniref:Vasoactive intestinal peptide n=1 Tax=Tetraodon nigroviridis TaxID=99883 RepID=H3BW21_TETNG